MTAPHDPDPDRPSSGDVGDLGSGTEAPPPPAGGASGTRRKGDKPPKSQVTSIVEWVLVIGGAVVLALIVKIVLLQAFYIPSASMDPTLQKGDRVLVNKLSYKLHDVNRGDIVVFERPPSETATNIPDLIKRVVGLPGEEIVITEGHVYIDGNLLDEPYLPEGSRRAPRTPR